MRINHKKGLKALFRAAIVIYTKSKYVSKFIMTTEAVVADKPEPPAPPAASGDDEMGGMY